MFRKSLVVLFVLCVSSEVQADEHWHSPSGDIQAKMGVGGGTFYGPVCFPDTVELQLGSACGDYWFVYNSATTEFEFWTTDSGAGVDATIWRANDGSKAFIVDGQLSAQSHISLLNNQRRYFGNNNDYWTSYYSASGEWVLYSSDVDGGGTDGPLLTAADGAGTVSHQAGTTAKTNISMVADTLTFPGGGAASQTSVGLIPDGAFVVGVSSRVVTSDTGACTSMDLGVTGDTDLFGNNVGIVDNDTTDNTDATASFHAMNLLPTTAAVNVIATGVGGNCADLVVDVYVHYMDTTAATSDL